MNNGGWKLVNLMEAIIQEGFVSLVLTVSVSFRCSLIYS